MVEQKYEWVHSGACHCASIGYIYRTRLKPADWSVRACQCSFCRAHQALSTSDPAGGIEFRASRDDVLGRYRFAQRTADFFFCRQCGVYIGALIETAGGQFGIINVRALRPAPSDLAPPIGMDYGDESASERIARREQRWSPVKQRSITIFAMKGTDPLV